ncbi:alpha/beta hydrolase [Candidatus Uhrbacteria bacterium]|nr:alpha/beta hydrolase [Candidatus Uhrbacteria bacterium]
MTETCPVLILFPGAWGNRTTELATWWLRHVINHFKDEYQIVVVTYKGTSLNAYVASALTQLKDIPDGSLALCYSMGAQIARGVATQRPKLFKRVALFSGLERGGVRVIVFLRALTFMLVPMLRTLIGRPLMLDTDEQVRRVFFQPLPRVHPRGIVELNRLTAGRNLLMQNLLDQRLIPEPAWAMLRLFLPGLRQRFPPLPCPVMAIIPRNDFILPGARYPREQIKRVEVGGDHSLILNEHNLAIDQLRRIATWFLTT